MGGHGAPRRVVVWADHSSDGAVTTRWAAHHAAARQWPVHLIQFPRAVFAAPDGYVDGVDLTGRDPGAEAALALMYAVRRIYVRHQDLVVTTQIAQNGDARPGPDVLRRGDILVTGPAGYIDLAEHALDTDVADLVGAPVVVVPAGTTAAAAAERRVVLLAGERLSEPAADFAFEAARDLHARLEVVMGAADGRVFGEGYWFSPAQAYVGIERRLRSTLASLQPRYRTVVCSTRTVLGAPWHDLHAITRRAQLTVLPDPVVPDEEVRRLLTVAASPLALVPA